VKTLELSYDGTPVAVLALEDVRGRQSFKLGPFPREISPQTFRLSFKITSVYPGTAGTPAELAEINFDGLDVHCFGPETPISLDNGTAKRIDRIVPGDTVQTFNFHTGQLEPARVSRLVAAVHAHLLRLHFEDRTVVATDDHPFWTESGAWASFNPFKSNTLYVQGTPVRALTPGDRIFLPKENRYVEWCGAAERCPNHLQFGVGQRSVVPGQRPAGADGGGIGNRIFKVNPTQCGCAIRSRLVYLH
jgi:hypothetical protein